MATVWELIQEHSTAPPGSTFWEHLNAQEGGGPGGTLILSDGLEIEMELSEVDIEVDLDSVDIEIETYEFDIEVDMSEYDVEVS